MTSTHQLAAIMFTDLVGYTTLMGESEEKAFRLLDLNRKLQKTQIEKYGGRYLKEMGDGILASFDSASKAVYCAGAIQKSAGNEDGLNLRIGIHLGDVVFKDGDIFGDGVNIASRIEPMADTGGIAVSEPVYRNVKNKEGIQAEFLGEKQLKNVEEPIRIYRVSIEGSISDISSTPPIKKETNGPTKKMTIPLIGVLVIVLGYFLFQYLFPEKSKSTNSTDSYSSIAVLPFADLSPEGDQEYLGDGIAEEIINVLTRIDGLKVIGRTSSFSFKEKEDDLVSIGSKLGVSTILEGSIRKSNNQIRVTAQLIKTEDGSHLWSQTYDRELEDIFAIQDEISARIAEKFKLTLTLSRADAPPTTNIEAYELFLRGIQLRDRGLVGTEEAILHLQQATELDPNFSEAYSILSEVYWAMGLYRLMDPNKAYSEARNAATTAIRIDPDRAENYVRLSWINFAIDWDWSGVKNNMTKAHELSALDFYEFEAYFKAVIYKRHDQSIYIIKKLLEDDPLSINYLLDLTRLYLYAGYYDSAIVNASKVLQMSPENSSTKRHLGEAYLFSGNYDQSLKFYGELLEKDPSYAPYGYIGALIGLGRQQEARTTFDSLRHSMSSLKTAMSYVHLNNMDSLLFYLDRAYEEKDTQVAFINVDPPWVPVRQNPGFLAFIERLNYPETSGDE